jgi:alcohol dehydrogenase class IV
LWKFTSPRTIIFGEDALEQLEQLEGERALVIAGRTVMGLGFVDRVVEYLETAGMEAKVIDFIEPEPSLETVREATVIAEDFEPDWIVGLGGGSSMDAAKAIWAMYENPGLDASEISPMDSLGPGRRARLMCIPTTSGSGSEATWATIITDKQGIMKIEIASRDLVPHLVISDPALAGSMSPSLTARTGLDALTHAMEAYVSTWRNDFSDALAIGAIKLIFDYLPKAIEDGGDMEAREKMHNAATMAGLAFGNAGVGIAHSLGHALGAMFNIHHGLAVGIFLPLVMEFNAQQVAPRYAEIARALSMPFDSDEEGARLLSQAVWKLMERMGEPRALCDAGIDRKEYERALDDLVEKAMISPVNLCNPREAGPDDCRQIFLMAYGP